MTIWAVENLKSWRNNLDKLDEEQKEGLIRTLIDSHLEAWERIDIQDKTIKEMLVHNKRALAAIRGELDELGADPLQP